MGNLQDEIAIVAPGVYTWRAKAGWAIAGAAAMAFVSALIEWCSS